LTRSLCPGAATALLQGRTRLTTTRPACCWHSAFMATRDSIFNSSEKSNKGANTVKGKYSKRKKPKQTSEWSKFPFDEVRGYLVLNISPLLKFFFVLQF
jgi:hypothetical protein